MGGWELALSAAWFRNRKAVIGLSLLLSVAAFYMVFTMWKFDSTHSFRWGELAANGWIEGFGYVYPLPVGVFLAIGTDNPVVETVRTRFLWTQDMSRTQWMGSQIAVLASAVLVLSGAGAMLFNWWAGRLAEIARATAWGFGQGDFAKQTFDITGFVMIGYGLFALALELFLATIYPRLVATVGGLFVFLVLRVCIAGRRTVGFFAPVARWAPVGQPIPVPAHSAVIVQGLSMAGRAHVASMSVGNVAGIVSRCTNEVLARITITGRVPSARYLPPSIHDSINACETAHEVRALTIFQPPSRFWAYQSIESAVFILLAGALSVAAIPIVQRRSA